MLFNDILHQVHYLLKKVCTINWLPSMLSSAKMYAFRNSLQIAIQES